ncbi:hypothetical protein BUALT_Bualt04G0101400 [Buddleja alternifolia]|uniref:Uncharacterized protein n=1 Tax=Buddleja alternifolia TaxID=168488 RepID=A0AAV6XV88_9LAMI|nr:hypothetical protein BUALT_Bualt04G0101400 [Buddleja alternifolia]
MGGSRSSSSSSGEEDGDAEWMAAIDSVATAATFTNGVLSSSNGRKDEVEEEETQKPQNIKLYQIKAQKMLDEILEKSIEVVTDSAHVLDENPAVNDNGVRLFKRAPPGIVFDHLVGKLYSCFDELMFDNRTVLLLANDLRGPTKKPKILPGDQLDEKSKKFRKQLQSAAVDGADIIAAAKAAYQKSLAKLEVREAAAKAAAKREEERVAELKKIRGERWLPSIAREMRVNAQRQR